MSLALDLFYILAVVLASPWVVYRLTATRAWPLALRRFGAGLEAQRRDCIWLHGSSVGEVTLLRPLVALLEREPDLDLVISSNTPTGMAAARAAYPRHRIVVFPLDFSFVVRRYLKRLKPRLVIIVESEIWPNFLLVARRQGIPLAVVNGKMSAKSFAIHSRTRFVGRALRGVNLLAVQTEEHAQRFRALGVPDDAVRVTGNMKYDLAPRADADARAELRAALGYVRDEIVLIGGSLHLLRWMASQGYLIPRARTFVQPNVVTFDHLKDLINKRSWEPGTRHRIDEIVFFGRLEARKGLFPGVSRSVLAFLHPRARPTRCRNLRNTSKSCDPRAPLSPKTAKVDLR